MAHRARKRFGQNFLQDERIVERIVGALAPARGDRLVEIGPGLGALTGPLLSRVDRLDVVELDRDLAASLPGRLDHPANLVIHQADALRFDFRALADGRALRLIGNLPYNISTPLLFHLLDQADADPACSAATPSSPIADMHFMLQQEVVERLVAEPDSSSRGRLSVMAQARADVARLFGVPPDAFQPAPKVDSAVVRIVPKTLDAAERGRLPALEEVVRAAFSQRRKTLRNTLKGLLDAEQIEAAGIDPARRAQTLSLGEFERLADVLQGAPRR